MKIGNITYFAASLVLTLATSPIVSAQVLNSAARTISLHATLPESLTVTLSASSVNFSLTAGSASNPGSTGIIATTQWVGLKPGRTAVTTYAYFSSAATALSDGGGHNIPSSAFFIADNGRPSTALTNTVPYAANAGLQLSNVPITGTNKTGSSTNSMVFNINLSGGTLPQLPAGMYTGILNVQAQVTP